MRGYKSLSLLGDFSIFSTAMQLKFSGPSVRVINQICVFLKHFFEFHDRFHMYISVSCIWNFVFLSTIPQSKVKRKIFVMLIVIN